MHYNFTKAGWVMFCCSLLYTTAFFAATKTSTAGGGDWSSVGTWVGGVLPSTNDDIVIATTAGNFVTMPGNFTCNALTINANSGLIINSGVTLTAGNALSAAPVNNGTITGGGNLTVGSSLVTFANNGIISVNNLTINALNSFNNNATVTTTGTLLISATGGYTNATGSILNIQGTISNSSGFGSFAVTANNNTVTYNSNSTQTVISGSTYYNLSLAGTGLKTFDGNVSINGSGTFSMNGGSVNLAGFTLTLGSSTASRGTLSYTSGALYNGTFQKWFNTSTFADGNIAGLFPMGNSTDYRPFYVSFPAIGPSVGGTLAVSHIDPLTVPVNVTITDGASTISKRATMNWIFTAANSFNVAAGNMNISIQGTSLGTVGDVNDLRVALASSVIGAAGTNGGTTTNPIVRRTGMPAFAAAASNTFYIGSVNGGSSPLPVELLFFEADARNNDVLLTWETASETNSDYYEIERTKDGTSYELLGRIDAAGQSVQRLHYTFIDDNPYKGQSYYRLKQVDYDGHFVYYGPINIQTKNSEEFFTVYPNPSNGSNLFINLLDERENVLLEIYNIIGEKVFAKNIEHHGEPLIPIIPTLSPGTYIVSAITPARVIYRKKLQVNR